MQNIICYVNAKNTQGEVRDFFNLQTVDAPTLTRTSEAAIKFRLFPEANTSTAYPISELTSVTSWQFIMDDDFDSSSIPILTADSASIVARSVTETINGKNYTFSEIYVPISSMNTAELISLLGTKESISLNGELIGLDSDAKTVFILQIMGFTIRNRMSTSGNPTPVQPEYLTAAETRALIAAGVDLQFSVDGSTNWHTTQADADEYVRFKSSTSASATWSGAIKLAKGIKGDTGEAGEDGEDGAGLAVDDFGVFADRPTEPEYSPFCYYATDNELVYFWNGTAWSSGVTLPGVAFEITTDATSTTATIANVQGRHKYKYGTISSLTLTAVENSNYEAVIIFTSGATATTFSAPSTLLWKDGSSPTPATNTTYIISIQNNLAECTAYKTA